MSGSILCPNCRHKSQEHVTGKMGHYCKGECECPFTSEEVIEKWIAQDRAQVRLAALAEGQKVVLTNACMICWSLSWAPCAANEPGAVKDPQDPQGEKYMFCQLCAAEQRIKEARRAALLEACKAECPSCRAGNTPVDTGFVWVHYNSLGSHCQANKIRYLLAQSQQEQAQGEGGGK